jgi:hypothetical protein
LHRFDHLLPLVAVYCETQAAICYYLNCTLSQNSLSGSDLQVAIFLKTAYCIAPDT